MKQKRLGELQALVASPAFEAWWAELEAARGAVQAAESKHEEHLGQTALMEFRAELAQKHAVDTLYRAGDHEDRAAAAQAEAEELENRSFRGVSEFEEQRYRTSEAWYRLGAADKKLEEARARGAGPADLEPLQRAQRSALADYEREDAQKARLWDEVEALWARSAADSLLVAEQKSLSGRVRKSAERLFEEALARKEKAKALATQGEAAARQLEAARARLSSVLEQARASFGCAVGTDFLYFRHRDDQRSAWCVALVQSVDGFNIEVRPRGLYRVDRIRGVAFLEPARAFTASAEDGDRRFEEYFLRGRKGEVRARS